MVSSRFVLQGLRACQQRGRVRVSSSGNTPEDRPLSQMTLRLSQSCLTVFSAFWIQDHSDHHRWRPENVSHSAAQSLGRSSSSTAVSVLTRGIMDGHLRPHGRSPRDRLYRVKSLSRVPRNTVASAAADAATLTSHLLHACPSSYLPCPSRSRFSSCYTLDRTSLTCVVPTALATALSFSFSR